MTSTAVLHARNAVFAIFFINGVLMASWISRIPAVRSTLDLSPGQLGLLLLCPAVGSALAPRRPGTSCCGSGRGTLHGFSWSARAA